MPQDHLIHVQVINDETADYGPFAGRNVFRFVTTDGNGKVKYSSEYEATTGTFAMYQATDIVDSEEYRTRDECNAIRRQVRKQLQAVNA